MRDGLVEALAHVGVGPGRLVFIHARLLAFARAARHISPRALPGYMLDCLERAGGGEATIVLPTFTFACSSFGSPFELYETPAETGPLAEALRQKEGSLRSLHPVVSVTAAGPQAEAITRDTPPASYGWDSPFDRMAELDTVVVKLGLNNNLSNSFSHYAEARAGVPYVYNKLLDYIPVTVGGKKVNDVFSMSVRHLSHEVIPDRGRAHDRAVRDSACTTTAHWEGGSIMGLDLADYLNILKREMARDPYFLLAGTPLWRHGVVPAEGPAGAVTRT